MQFVGKVVLITGASSGIGAATAKLFSKHGASLTLAGRNVDNLKEVFSECNETLKGASAEDKLGNLMVTVDLRNENDVKSLVEKTIQHFGKLDILVNNAGILASGSIEQTNLEQYDEVMNINMRSVYHLTQLCVPYLTKTKGTIVNVSSVNGIRAFPGVLAYCVSKAALDQFTRCVALELAPKQVRCNSVNPGVTVTNLHKRSGMNEAQYQQFLERSKETHALGRPGTVDEVAKSILFLAGEESSNITGVTLACDGGRHAMCPR